MQPGDADNVEYDEVNADILFADLESLDGAEQQRFLMKIMSSLGVDVDAAQAMMAKASAGQTVDANTDDDSDAAASG